MLSIFEVLLKLYLSQLNHPKHLGILQTYYPDVDHLIDDSIMYIYNLVNCVPLLCCFHGL